LNYISKEGEEPINVSFVTPKNTIADDEKFVCTLENSSTVLNELIKVASFPYYLLRNYLSSDEEKERWELSSALFKQTVLQVLEITKVLSFS
jgi:hypothetical protein